MTADMDPRPEKLQHDVILKFRSFEVVEAEKRCIFWSSYSNRDVRQPLSQVRLSLSASLGAGQIIFLVGINTTEYMAACITAAALMQYFLMAAFCWMLVEGIYLYLFVVKVYNINTKMHMYHVMSWGIYEYLPPYLVYDSPTYSAFFCLSI
ncbi:Cadherin EGF LAG seven-pass G-type receptor 3 [Stylophora pistillata]|uniref:Cadherin EGF LAG seven-pass G-type receptor 3 n=1 Tax=Stylophora pistillata TaxID=50429 RepID=A0A2B4RTI9_STYPI|nr:Cadherin EGF LAG seven-pass G-type receptor 3 [Stylophora pistillata]